MAPKCIQKHRKSIFSTLVSTLKTKKVEVCGGSRKSRDNHHRDGTLSF